MAKISNKVKDRKKPTRRGKPTNAKSGNYESLLAKILHEDAKFAADCANKLPDFHRNILKMADKEDEYKSIGIKDQWAAMKFCMDITEKFLDEHYEAEDEEDGEGVNTQNQSTETKATGTEGKIISLISTDYE
ncbi:hypothetical protein NVP1084O_114 [Vibrio phage 1.084.O._10N.261.49.F5]|nr:hypothetical protein NVP1084O_114 [Vibrio phage 1.084.O._10N.261.49.F5]